MSCPEGVLWFPNAVLMTESCISRGILLIQYQGRRSLCARCMYMCGPKNAMSHFFKRHMVLASFGCFGVSARPPLSKNCVLVICMSGNCLVICASVSDCVCAMVMLSMMIGGMIRVDVVVFVLVFCGGGGEFVVLLTHVWVELTAGGGAVPASSGGEKYDLTGVMR